MDNQVNQKDTALLLQEITEFLPLLAETLRWPNVETLQKAERLLRDAHAEIEQLRREIQKVADDLTAENDDAHAEIEGLQRLYEQNRGVEELLRKDLDEEYARRKAAEARAEAADALLTALGYPRAAEGATE